jgi:pimeloyl-ACP methyl ester carboxylesterase
MPVSHRLALVFPGFEPLPVEAHCARFIREAKRTAPAYAMDLSIGEPVYSDAGLRTGRIEVSASGAGWKTDTDVVVYGLGDLNAAYAARNPLMRLLAGLCALGDFIVTGTFFRFVSTSWRYSLFFLYPLITLFCVLVVALVIGVFLPANAVLRWTIAVFACVGLLWFASARMYFLLMMDDWAFARDMARERRPDVDKRIAAVAADIDARLGAFDHQEVILAAHSFGAITVMLAMASLLSRGCERRRVGLLTVGSSLLKVALHPAAHALRRAVGVIAKSAIIWVDCQSLTDPMNFYGSSPLRTLRIREGREAKIVHVRFRRQLNADTYRAIKHDFFRVHRQFVYGVECRSPYAFHAILCGPEPFAAFAEQGKLSESWPPASKKKTA